MITRRPLREEVRGEVMKRVLNGDLPPSTRLKEVSLADSLGVSRTPLREALRDLEHIGIVSCTPGRGYAVRELSPEEARHTFPMLSALEDLALDTSPIDGDRLERLNSLTRSLAGATNPLTPIEIDLAWHEQLTANTSNARLNQAILELQACTQRYECTCLTADAQAALRDDHLTITRELEQQGSAADVAGRLRRHREHAMNLVLEQLRAGAREAEAAEMSMSMRTG